MAVETNPPAEAESGPSTEATTPEKSKSDLRPTSPKMSRYGRARKPKVSNDFIPHDKSVKSFLASGTSILNNSLNGNEQTPSTSKQKSVLKRKSVAEPVSENTEIDEIKSPKNDIGDFFTKSSENEIGEDIPSEIGTTLPVEVTEPPKSEAKSAKRGRKKKVETTVAVATPSSSKLCEESVGSEKPDSASNSETPNSAIPVKVAKMSRRTGRSSILNPVPEESCTDLKTSTETTLEVMKTPASTSNTAVSTVLTPLMSDSTKSKSDVITPVIVPSTVLLTPLKTPLSSCGKLSTATPNSEFVGDPDKDWLVGDVAWGSIGKHPYWPSIIMTDPVSNKHFMEKGYAGSKGPRKHYFLQFCGDNGRHCWLGGRNLLEFVSKQQFLDLQAKIDLKKSIYASKFLLNKTKDTWEVAVAEAEHLLSLPREDRIQYFQRLYPMEIKRTKKDLLALLLTEEEPTSSDKLSKASTSGEPMSNNLQEPSSAEMKKPAKSPKKATIVKSNNKLKTKVAKNKNPLKLTLKEKMLPSNKLALLKKKKKLKFQLLQKGKKEKKEKTKRAYKKKIKSEENENDVGTVKNGLEGMEVDKAAESTVKVKTEKNAVEKRKKKRKLKQEFGPDFDMYSSKNFDRISDEHPHLKDEEIERYLQKIWLEMDEKQKLKYKSRLVKEESANEESGAESESSEAEIGTVGSDSRSAECQNGNLSLPPIVEAVSKTKKNNKLFR